MKWIVPALESGCSWRIICTTSEIKVMLVKNGLRTVIKIQGFTFCPALIIYGIPMEKKNRAHASPNVYRCDNHWDPPTDHSLSFHITLIHTYCDTHGFWVCHHPSPPLHSPGQYPQPGWSSLNSPVFTHRKRQSGGYNNVPHLWYLLWFNWVRSLAHWPWGLLPVAASLWVSGSRHVPSPSPSPWKTLCRRWSRRWRETAGRVETERWRERTGKTNLKILTRQIWQCCERMQKVEKEVGTARRKNLLKGET